MTKRILCCVLLLSFSMMVGCGNENKADTSTEVKTGAPAPATEGVQSPTTLPPLLEKETEAKTMVGDLVSLPAMPEPVSNAAPRFIVDGKFYGHVVTTNHDDGVSQIPQPVEGYVVVQEEQGGILKTVLEATAADRYIRDFLPTAQWLWWVESTLEQSDQVWIYGKNLNTGEVFLVDEGRHPAFKEKGMNAFGDRLVYQLYRGDAGQETAVFDAATREKTALGETEKTYTLHGLSDRFLVWQTVETSGTPTMLVHEWATDTTYALAPYEGYQFVNGITAGDHLVLTVMKNDNGVREIELWHYNLRTGLWDFRITANTGADGSIHQAIQRVQINERYLVWDYGASDEGHHVLVDMHDLAYTKPELKRNAGGYYEQWITDDAWYYTSGTHADRVSEIMKAGLN